ncbi:amino acid ABC transporter substrate-binding protein [Siccirubricoccus sp. KC 17139]|uniref:Amino acid ABC transporter substrate-binding protein n=1 Tax=Siccirubricoccus soli TaxID=2899147 RepID=A0ABT1D068_9PROT|nr:amino acid ABC transporter substrate-binding protein [Siccirubricoccus soli]MCO6415313.1 amino acid ABC transporter substrate-binding protein [Siccirubricoccus soli]MCP2681445.1 amino acid ABC transporter substrate-binding protein [Siccirubricoccus soli]
MDHLTRRQFGRLSLAAAIAGAGQVAGVFPALAQSANPIRIGFAMALSGGLAGNGRATLLAYQIWAQEVNARGGILGRPVQLVFYDDQTQPGLVPGIYTKLLDVDKVDIVTSPYATAMIAPAMPVVMQRNVTFLTIFGAGVNEAFKYDRHFNVNVVGDNMKETYATGYFEVAAMLPAPPRSIAIAAVDNEFAQKAAESARYHAKKRGIRIVYDRSYPPSTVDFTPIIRAMQSGRPDLVFIASYPPDSSGLVRAANELRFTPAIFGGGLVGPQLASFQSQFGPLLNNLVTWDVYSPEPTMDFPGVATFLQKYRELAPREQTDLLGNYIPPYAYAQMQTLEQTLTRIGKIDQAAMAADMHAQEFDTIVGKFRFSALGEWAEPRNLFVQFQGITDNELERYKRPGAKVILAPASLKSGSLRTPYGAAG